MNKKKFQEISKNIEEFPEKISHKTKPKLSEEERKLRKQFYAN